MIDERVPPHDLLAEQAVLGGVIVRNELLDELADTIEAGDFYRAAHQKLWQTMESLREVGRPLDAVTLGDALKPEGIDAIGPGYIAELVAAPPVVGEVRHYAAIVKERSIQRRLAAFGCELAAKVYDAPPRRAPDFTDELLAGAEYDLAQIASSVTRKPEKSAKELLSEALTGTGLSIGLLWVFLPASLASTSRLPVSRRDT